MPSLRSLPTCPPEGLLTPDLRFLLTPSPYRTYAPHFADGDSGAQRGGATCLRSHSSVSPWQSIRAGMVSVLRLPESRSRCLGPPPPAPTEGGQLPRPQGGVAMRPLLCTSRSPLLLNSYLSLLLGRARLSDDLNSGLSACNSCDPSSGVRMAVPGGRRGWGGGGGQGV